jgi:ATP-dependent Lhr-like helicase
LLRATRADAASGASATCSRGCGHITVRDIDGVSPLAVPILLEIGRESVYGQAVDTLLDEAATELIEEAIGGVSQAQLSFG